MFIQLPTIFTIFHILSLPFVRAEQEYITSDGVVYGDALVTSTVKPPHVYLTTSYFTTTQVRPVTLDDTSVISTTEAVLEGTTMTKSGSTHLSTSGSEPSGVQSLGGSSSSLFSTSPSSTTAFSSSPISVSPSGSAAFASSSSVSPSSSVVSGSS
ncbi:daughter-specific expression- protein, partial [Zygosaccharomyces mellis]